MPNVIVDLPGSLKSALDQEVARIKRSTPSVVTQALSAIPRDAGSYPIPSVDRWYVQHGGRAGSTKVRAESPESSTGRWTAAVNSSVETLQYVRGSSQESSGDNQYQRPCVEARRSRSDH
jgi:hypothetical protein